MSIKEGGDYAKLSWLRLELPQNVSASPPPPPISPDTPARPRDLLMASKQGQSPHLRPGEVTLLEYADDSDIVTLSDKEALVLQLADQIQEQQLEKALLEQGTRKENMCIAVLFLCFDLLLFTSPC